MPNTFQQQFERYVIGPYHYSAPSMTLIILGLLVLLAFEVWMLVDVLAYRKMPTSHRLWWVLGMFLVHPIVALVYFIVRGRYKKLS